MSRATHGRMLRLVRATALGLLTAVGCESAAEPDPVGVFDVRITPAVDTVAAADTARFQVSATDARGRPVAAHAVWSTSNPSAASVDSSGFVRAIAPGAALITAVVEGRQAAARLVVTRARVAAVRMEDLEMLEGTNVFVTATVYDARGVVLLDRLIEFDSTDPQVAELSGGRSPTLYARRPGTALVVATSEGSSDTAVVTVRRARVIAAVIHPTEGLTYTGEVRELDLEPAGDNGLRLDRPARWSSANPAVAVVDSLGRARGVGPGTTVITAVSEGVEARMQLTVLPPVAPLSFVTLSPQEHEGCGVVRGGAAYCWGDNPLLSLGSGPLTERDGPSRSFTAMPLRVGSGHAFRQVHPIPSRIGVPAARRVCGLDTVGTALCWGADPTPNPLPGGLTFLTMDAGYDRYCGISADQAVYCWAAAAGTTPVRLPGTGRYHTVSVERARVCAVRVDDLADCWSGVSLPADGSAATLPAPTPVPGGHRFQTVGVGSEFACGLTLDGQALCWGGNFVGQLGNGTFEGPDQPEPREVAGGRRFRALDVGGSHACAIDQEERVYCWGYGFSGQLGNGVSGSRFIAPVPVAVAGGHRFASVHAGGLGTCGIAVEGTTYCWGHVTPGANEPVNVPREIPAQ